MFDSILLHWNVDHVVTKICSNIHHHICNSSKFNLLNCLMQLLYCLRNNGIKVWGNSLIPFVWLTLLSHCQKLDEMISQPIELLFSCQKLFLEVRISYILPDTFTDNAIILHFPLLCITFLFLQINYKMFGFGFKY